MVQHRRKCRTCHTMDVDVLRACMQRHVPRAGMEPSAARWDDVVSPAANACHAKLLFIICSPKVVAFWLFHLEQQHVSFYIDRPIAFFRAFERLIDFCTADVQCSNNTWICTARNVSIQAESKAPGESEAGLVLVFVVVAKSSTCIRKCACI